MSGPWLAILGINEDGVLPPAAAQRVAAASLVVGGARHLALAAPLIRGDSLAWPSPLAAAIPAILARRPDPVVVLASGDPLWFGIGSLLLRHVPAAETLIIPAPSSFALAAARLGWALQDVACLSCCGRPVEALRPYLHEGARLLVLCADASTPAAVATLLRSHGFVASTLHLMEALGGARERIRAVAPDALPADIAALTLLAIEASGAPGLSLAPGLDDALFEHDGQITKNDIRALTLSALAPRPGDLLWDIGCGAGSVAIEWMLRHASCRAIGIEQRADRAARARLNAARFGVPTLDVVEGEAPLALAGLPPPDAVFVGGAVHRAPLLDAAWAALRPGGRLVANAIALASETALVAAQSRYGGTLLRIGLERLDQVGRLAAFRPAMTVTQWRAEKPR